MVKLLTFLLISYGATNIMIYGSIFSKWRDFWDEVSPNFFGQLFSCFICLPFWWGVILGLLLVSPSTSIFTTNLIIDNLILNKYLPIFFDGCLSSGGVWLLHTIQEKLEK
jgi:hypothetical protein